jgi:hypothetical protein
VRLVARLARATHSAASQQHARTQSPALTPSHTRDITPRATLIAAHHTPHTQDALEELAEQEEEEEELEEVRVCVRACVCVCACACVRVCFFGGGGAAAAAAGGKLVLPRVPAAACVSAIEHTTDTPHTQHEPWAGTASRAQL